MISQTEQIFKKKTACPPTTDIVLFLSNTLSGDKASGLQRHLITCDFCGAEADLIAHHSPEPEHFEIPLMPVSLRRLAESLLPGHLPLFHNLDPINDEINALS
jgi:hypothetical protein